MNIDSSFPSKFLRAVDIPENASIRLTIRDVHAEEVAKGENKPVIFFAGRQKGMVLNKTNAEILKASFGPETDSWSGQQVTMTRTLVNFQGKLVPAIRLNAAPAATAAAAAPASPISEAPAFSPEDIPF